MDDEDSIQSISTQDQINFWSLTGSFMLKLMAMGVTIFILPYNEWVVLDGRDHSFTFIRGISGSDCAQRTNSPFEIECIRWAEIDRGYRSKFWSDKNMNYQNVRAPSSEFTYLYYFVVFLILLYILDLVATLVMCCRYRSQTCDRTTEKRLSFLFSATILVFYAGVSLIVLCNTYNFIDAESNLQACLGNAFKLFVSAAFLFLFGALLIALPKLFIVDDKESTPFQRAFRTARTMDCLKRETNYHTRGRVKEETVQLQNR